MHFLHHRKVRHESHYYLFLRAQKEFALLLDGAPTKAGRTFFYNAKGNAFFSAQPWEVGVLFITAFARGNSSMVMVAASDTLRWAFFMKFGGLCFRKGFLFASEVRYTRYGAQ